MYDIFKFKNFSDRKSVCHIKRSFFFSNQTIAILETVNITPKGYVVTVSPRGTVGTKA